MAAEVGVAFVSLVPSARNFSALTKRELAGALRGVDAEVALTPDVDRADVTRALTGATAGQRGAVQVATDVDAGQLRRETRAAIVATEATRPTVRVRTDVDRNTLQRSLVGLGASGGRGAGASFLSGFSGALKPSLISVAIGGALLLSGPLVAAASLFGASLGAIVLAAFGLRGDKQVGAAVKGLLGDINSGLTDAAKPLRGPFLEALGIIRQALVDIAPDLREMFAAIAPYIPELARGVAGFLRAFTPGMVQAIKDSGPVINAIAAALPDLGQALGQFLETMGKVAPQAGTFIGMMLRGLADLMRLLGSFEALMSRTFEHFVGLFSWIHDRLWESKEGWKIIILAMQGDRKTIEALIDGTVAKIRQAWDWLWRHIFPDAPRAGVSTVLGTVRAVPGQIVSALGNTSKLLWQAGRNILQGLINGIKSKFSGPGSLSSAMSAAASMARSFWPFSPAKQGPLSGHGSLFYAGQNLVDDLTGGMATRLPQVASASSQLAGAVGMHAGAGAAAAGTTVVLGSDGTRVGDLLVEILREAIEGKGGNPQVVLGRNRG